MLDPIISSLISTLLYQVKYLWIFCYLISSGAIGPLTNWYVQLLRSCQWLQPKQGHWLSIIHFPFKEKEKSPLPILMTLFCHLPLFSRNGLATLQCFIRTRTKCRTSEAWPSHIKQEIEINDLQGSFQPHLWFYDDSQKFCRWFSFSQI